MNSKMTTNSQLSTNESKNQNQKQTKQTTRTGTESIITEMEITWSVISGRRRGKNGGKVQGIRSIIGRYKMGGLKIVWEMEKAKNLYV